MGQEDDPLLYTIFKDWMPKLTDTELRVFLVILKRTICSKKNRAWISHTKLQHAARRPGGKLVASRSVSRALSVLIGELGIVVAETEGGGHLATSLDRMKYYGKIYYRLSPKVIPSFSTSPVQVPISELTRAVKGEWG